MLQHDCQCHTRLVSINKKYAFYSCFCPDIRASFPLVLQALIQCVFNSEMIRYHTEMAIPLSQPYISIEFASIFLFPSNHDFSSLIGGEKKYCEKNVHLLECRNYQSPIPNNTHSLWNEIWWKNKIRDKYKKIWPKMYKILPI